MFGHQVPTIDNLRSTKNEGVISLKVLSVGVWGGCGADIHK